MTPKVYIDGKEGTTGLQIYDRLAARRDIDLLLIDEDKRKDPAERKKLMDAADIVFLCLPDGAAVEAVGLVDNPNTRIIDASTAHRVAPGWTYGFPELSAEQREAIAKGIRAIETVCGVTPEGFRSPEGELTLDTLRIAKELGLTYSSNLCDDDRPYFKDLGGGDSILEIPIHWDNYDLPYFAFNYHPAFPAGQGRIANYSGVLSNWMDDFDGCREYGLCYVLQLDPAAIGAPGRIELLEELLDHMTGCGDVWFATGHDMQAYYNK